MEVQLEGKGDPSSEENGDQETARKARDQPSTRGGSVGGVPAQTYEAVDGTTVVIPRGKPKSGKFWKTVRSERHSNIKKDKPLRTTWNKKMQQRAEKQSIKSFEKELKELKQKQLEEKRKRQEEHKKHKLENERKSEIVQPNILATRPIRDVNLFSLKKTVALALFDITVLAANTAQVKFVRHNYNEEDLGVYRFTMVMLGLSIILLVATAAVLLYMATFNIERDNIYETVGRKAHITNDIIASLVLVITIVNVLVAVFGCEPKAWPS
uniref:Coiled-coil domain-containing protein 86 n=1 Tax=Branchiostoma floridae TaxID=7739 RepID=C3XZH9_BRAFL|eukprot:XP_002610490.1 hypothetical protein BRAFLDRAFT_117812 [Branchiostoma floridae]